MSLYQQPSHMTTAETWLNILQQALAVFILAYTYGSATGFAILLIVTSLKRMDQV